MSKSPTKNPKRKRTYNIRYKLSECAPECVIRVESCNCPDAYDKAVFEAIPEAAGHCPYSAWVESVEFKNGQIKRFNTFEGQPY